MLTKFEHWRMCALNYKGWRRAFFAFLLGAFSVLALPPIHFVPALVPSFVGLIWMLDGSVTGPVRNWRYVIKQHIFNGAFAIGWWFGLGFFSAGLYWISFSFLVDAEQFAWMIPFALGGLSGSFAVYIGLVSALAFRLARPGLRRVIYFCVLWVVFEWVRGWPFTGFPWNFIGTIWTFNEEMIQFSSLSGVMGLSLMSIIAASSVALLGYGHKSPCFRYCAAILPFAVLALIWVGGFWRLAGTETQFVEDVRLRLVQPNINQKAKWKFQLRGKHLNNLLELSEGASHLADDKKPTHIIWPETAIPFFLDGNEAALRVVAAITPPNGALLTGALRRTGGEGTRVKLWNSLHVIGPDAKISATYDKFHLVPFGEYVPLREYFYNFVNFEKLTAGRTDFSSGSGQRTIVVPGAPLVSPLICYEVIFSGGATSVAKEGQARPGWILNITNDAWFGASSGPYQHLASAQLRAVEEGLPLVRVANTGISAVIDGYGRIIKRSQLNERTYLDVALPKALTNRTLFSRVKLFSLFILMLGIILILRVRRLD